MGLDVLVSNVQRHALSAFIHAGRASRASIHGEPLGGCQKMTPLLLLLAFAGCRMFHRSELPGDCRSSDTPPVSRGPSHQAQRQFPPYQMDFEGLWRPLAPSAPSGALVPQVRP